MWGKDTTQGPPEGATTDILLHAKPNRHFSQVFTQGPNSYHAGFHPHGSLTTTTSTPQLLCTPKCAMVHPNQFPKAFHTWTSPIFCCQIGLSTIAEYDSATMEPSLPNKCWIVQVRCDIPPKQPQIQTQYHHTSFHNEPQSAAPAAPNIASNNPQEHPTGTTDSECTATNCNPNPTGSSMCFAGMQPKCNQCIVHVQCTSPFNNRKLVERSPTTSSTADHHNSNMPSAPHPFTVTLLCEQPTGAPQTAPTVQPCQTSSHEDDKPTESTTSNNGNDCNELLNDELAKVQPNLPFRNTTISQENTMVIPERSSPALTYQMFIDQTMSMAPGSLWHHQTHVFNNHWQLPLQDQQPLCSTQVPYSREKELLSLPPASHTSTVILHTTNYTHRSFLWEPDWTRISPPWPLPAHVCTSLLLLTQNPPTSSSYYNFCRRFPTCLNQLACVVQPTTPTMAAKNLLRPP